MASIIQPSVIMSATGVIAALILVVAYKFFTIVDTSLKGPIREVLPGANCGACGFTGCDLYAEYLANEENPKTNLCVPGGDGASRAISEILGVDFADVEEKVAFVGCRGHLATTDYIMEYQGPPSCAVCNNFYQGRRSCSFACLGFGDCVKACQYDAIHVVNGVAVVDKNKCVGCGMCESACPNAGLIRIVPAKSDVVVACTSKNTGAFTRKLCKNGCIGCKKCVRTCEHDAITVENSLAVVDPDKCVNCGNCVAGCPTGAILFNKKGCENLAHLRANAPAPVPPSETA